MLSIVEVVNKLIVCTDVVNDGNDTQQLAPMALQAKEVLEVDRLAASGDTGYYDKAQIKTCVDAGVIPYVAIPDKEAPVREAGRLLRQAQHKFLVQCLLMILIQIPTSVRRSKY